MNPLMVNTREAKSRLSELIREAEKGVDVIVSRNGQPVARIIAYVSDSVERKAGAWEGKVVYHEGFDEADREIEEMFEASAQAELL